MTTDTNTKNLLSTCSGKWSRDERKGMKRVSGLEEAGSNWGPITRDAQENRGKGDKWKKRAFSSVPTEYASSGLGRRAIYTVLLLFKTSCVVEDIDIDIVVGLSLKLDLPVLWTMRLKYSIDITHSLGASSSTEYG